MEYVLAGKILNTFGIKGELKVEIHTDFVDERFKEGSLIYIGEDKKEFICKKYRIHQGYVLLTLKDFEDINLVEHLKNNNIYIKTDDLKPLNNAYYFKDLIDLDVYVESNKVGKIIEAQDGFAYKYIRVLKNDNKTVLVPFVDAFIKEVNLKEKKIIINNIEGLL